MLAFVLGLVALAGGLAYAFTRPGSDVSVDLPGVKLRLSAPTHVQVSPKKLRSLDASDYVIDDLLGFAYRRPRSPPWSQPTATHGLRALLAAQQFSSTRLSPAQLDASLRSFGRLGAMLRGVDTVRITSGRPLRVRMTDASRQVVLGTRQPTGAATLAFRNTFAVDVYDKRLLGGVHVPLASLFATTVNATLADVAVEGKVIVGTEYFHYANVLVGGRRGRLDFYHAYLFAQSPRRFYVVEIVYSPQTHEARARWRDLQAMLKSFVVR